MTSIIGKNRCWVSSMTSASDIINCIRNSNDIYDKINILVCRNVKVNVN